MNRPLGVWSGSGKPSPKKFNTSTPSAMTDAWDEAYEFAAARFVKH